MPSSKKKITRRESHEEKNIRWIHIGIPFPEHLGFYNDLSHRLGHPELL